MSKTLIIGIGNTLRGDDGVAARVLELCGSSPAVDHVLVHQLTFDLAGLLSQYERVLFIDAAAGERPASWRFVALPASYCNASPLGHDMHPGELLALTRSLYGWSPRGELLLIGGGDFRAVCELSTGVALAVPEIARQVRERCAVWSGNHRESVNKVGAPAHG